jgi:biopolymer transport protein ExbD
MARHKSLSPQESLDPSLDISSLIDVCFLLLIYFLVATTLQKREFDVPLQMGGKQLDTHPADIEPLRLNIHRDGAISCGTNGANSLILDTDVSSRYLPILEGFLGQYRDSLGLREPLVQIRVDQEAQQQRVMDVLNAMVGQKITHVAFMDQ